MYKLDEIITLQKRKYDLLAVGELLVDMISEDYADNLESSRYLRFFGGSPANIAINAKKLGINSVVAAAVGQDGLGKFLASKLEGAGMDTSFIQQTDYPTSMVLISKSVNSPAAIFYRGADFRLLYTKELEEAVKAAGIIHFSCWPLSRIPARHAIEKAVETAKANDVLICFDPNYHRMIWQEGETGEEYIKSIIGMTDIVKPSKDDAERLFGTAEDEEHVEMFLRLGAKLVIMTLGKDGAIVSNGEETIRINSMATDVADTTGAGDAFWAGFYASAARGCSIREALNLGFAVSAYKLKFVGAVVDLPELEKIKELYGL